MHRLPPQTPSPATTCCSDMEFKCFVGSQCSQVRRRSQRLIDKDNQVLAKTPKCRSPQLFGESEDLYSQLLCQQEKQPSKVVHLKETDKVVHLQSVAKIGHSEPLKAAGANEKVVHLKPLKAAGATEKVIHLKPSDKALNNLDNSKPSAQILHLKQQKEVKESFHQKNLKRKRSYQGSSQPAAKRRAKTPLNRHEAVKVPLPKKHFRSSNSSSQSKLPPTYPDHFAKQLKDTSCVHIQVKSAPPAQLQELCPTPEPTPIGIWNKSSPNIDSESSMAISLSDSIGEIFGSKDVSDILSVKCPRQYILIEDHLPAVATMLNVDVDRLRNVLEITQRLTHDQILGFPIKKEEDEPAPPSGDFSGLN